MAYPEYKKDDNTPNGWEDLGMTGRAKDIGELEHREDCIVCRFCSEYLRVGRELKFESPEGSKYIDYFIYCPRCFHRVSTKSVKIE